MVLIAIRTLGTPTVKELCLLIEKHIHSEISTGSIYTTLKRLGEKGFVHYVHLPKKSIRGGKSKKVYMLRKSGFDAITLAEVIRYQIVND